MAALIKLRNMPVMQRCVWNHYSRMCRNISTSKKNSDTATATCEPPKAPEKSNENWVSYGFDYTSKEEDDSAHHASFFFSVSLCLVFGGFLWGYAPDNLNRDWAQREAFLELRRREKAGLPLIDPNYVSPSCVRLPSDKELGDTEIII